ncbi:MAG: DNA cytosine methyltransferase [Actinomycetales bacterium]
MRTVTLAQFLDKNKKLAHTRRPRQRATSVPVVDLYCGIGGFSTGATAAGHRVELAVDGWDDALNWHHRNHPETNHQCHWLPSKAFHAQLPPPGTLFHMHGSPPCQLLSQAHGADKRCERWDEGLDNVRYYLDLVHERHPASWSMEQVANRTVIKLLKEYQKRWPQWLEFEVCDMSEWGVPQTRKRVIAGSPFLIRRLRDRRQPFKKVTVRMACRSSIPKGALGIKGQRGNWGNTRNGLQGARAFQAEQRAVPMERRVRPGGLDVPAPTVLRCNTLQWAGEGGNTVRGLTLKEHAQIQTFPDSYHFPTNDRKLSQALCGNSVPPEFARVLMQDYRLPDETAEVPPEAVFPPRPPSPSLSW